MKLLLVRLLICALCGVAQSLLDLELISDTEAICNAEGTRGIFYHDSSASTKWIIYFEGGAGCSSREECNERYNDTRNRPLMSSSEYFATVSGRGLLADDEDENPTFHNFNHVYVPYCSSDAWLGTRTNPDRESHFNPNNKTGDYFSYRGSTILRGVINDLHRFGIGNSTEVILVGSSASGVGVLGHAQWIQRRLNNSKVALIIDSAWFIDFDQVLSNMVNNELGELYNLSNLDIPSCHDVTHGFPCCLSPACHLMHNSLPAQLPNILFIFSQYDAYALQFVLRDSYTLRNISLTTVDMLRLFNEYGSAMITNANITFQRGNFSFFIPACSQHRYLIPSDFWDSGGFLTRTTDTVIREDLFEFHNPLKPGETWRRITASGLTLHDFISQWYNSNYSKLYVADDCSGPLCNDNCTDSIVYLVDANLWDISVSAVIITIAGLLTIVCVVAKITFYYYQKYIFYKQKKFVVEMTSVEDHNLMSQLDNLLPSCTQHCSVSCVNLSYRLETYKPPNDKTASLKHRQSGPKPLLSILKKNRSEQGDTNSKTILKNINLYFNPGELVAIMGPSGCGKTTLLNVLTGNRLNGEIEGDIFINGISVSKMKEWFTENTGYVLQLATPFYEELTVRENLLLSANMQLSRKATWEQKMERVERIIRETGLLLAANVTVGGPTGSGLSGGEKRRLSIAMQLLRIPNILFLDEPTSGLDASSSLSLLKTLHCLAQSGRAIVLTIHQPRIEIFHMFDKILLLCKGQVAYFGSPFKAPTYFSTALNGDEGKMNKAANPADVILDILTKEKSQMAILRAYQSSGEPQAIQTAIKNAQVNDSKAPTSSTSHYPGLFLRLVSLESRASLRQSIVHIIYLPVVYCVFAFILGSVYFETRMPVQIMSVTCLTSCSSSLFMSSIVMGLLIKPLEIFQLEYTDGIAYPHEVVLQVFIRMSALCTGPLTVCATILFFSVYQQYDFVVYLIVLLSFLLVNQVWVSMFIFITCGSPSLAHRICPLVAAICGFCCGFIVPKSLMPNYYRWIFYINPSYYAYAATTTAVLNDIDSSCPYNSDLECLQYSGKATLRQFGLEGVSPVFCLLILIIMVVVYISAAILVLRIKLAAPHLKRSIKTCTSKRRSGRVLVLNDSSKPSQFVIGLTTNANKTTKSSFLEMEGQSHQVMHYYKPNQLEIIAGNESPHSQQLKRQLSILSDDDNDSIYSDTSVINMNESETERFLRSMNILLNRRQKMDELINLPGKTTIQSLVTGTANTTPRSERGFRRSPQKIFSAPNHSLPAINDNAEDQMDNQPDIILLQTNDEDWQDVPAVTLYPSNQNSHSNGRSSIESITISEL